MSAFKKTDPHHSYMAKIIIIGNSSVGKTSIVLRYTWNGIGEYELCHTPTIGLDFKTKTVKHKDKYVKLQIWDTAGQQRFRNVTDSYYHGVSGVILVYGVDDRKSFEDITDWMLQVSKKTEETVPRIIVANKCQLSPSDPQKRQVSTHQGRMLAQQYNAHFIQASAKENINIQQIFETLTNSIMKNFEKEEKHNEHRNSILMVCKKENKSKLSGIKQEKSCCS